MARVVKAPETRTLRRHRSNSNFQTLWQNRKGAPRRKHSLSGAAFFVRRYATSSTFPKGHFRGRSVKIAQRSGYDFEGNYSKTSTETALPTGISEPGSTRTMALHWLSPKRACDSWGPTG